MLKAYLPVNQKNFGSQAFNESVFSRQRVPAQSLSAGSSSKSSPECLKLQILDIGDCCVPAGVWKHMFPLARSCQTYVCWTFRPSSKSFASVPRGSLLVSCCLGLQTLFMKRLRYTAKRIASLKRLDALRTLVLQPAPRSAEGRLVGVCKLRGLRDLKVRQLGVGEERLLRQLTRLRKLTSLECETSKGPVSFRSEVSG
jgi:hypothetical protein